MTNENLIVIIGNGFDLAHDLKTSYNDFANHYLNRIIEKLKTDFDSPFFNKTLKKYYTHYLNVGNQNSTNETYNKVATLFNKIRYSTDKKEANEYLQSNPEIVQLIISNEFLGKLFANKYDNWFDIENAFFQELITHKNEILRLKDLAKEQTKSFQGSIQNNRKIVSELNKELVDIKIELNEYLKSIKINKSISIENFFKRNLKNAKKIHFINFNYTDTLSLYLNQSLFLDKEINNYHIHGKINSNIFFGYGNDQNNDYKEMKDLGFDEFLENFKTFEYLDNINYQRISSILSMRNVHFDTLVIGHSLQQTDKTLLGEVFNNQNCQKVRLLRRGDLLEIEKKREYKKLTFALSRIFENENELRVKVLNFNDTIEFP